MTETLDVKLLARVTGGEGQATCWNATKNAWDFSHNPVFAGLIGASCVTGVSPVPGGPAAPPATRSTPDETARMRSMFEDSQQIRNNNK